MNMNPEPVSDAFQGVIDMFGKKDENVNPAVPETAGGQSTGGSLNEDAISQLIKKTDKQLRWMRIMCISAVAVAVMLLFVCGIIVPKAVHTLTEVNSLMEEASVLMDNANTTLAGIDSMSKEITDAADGINGLVETNADVLTDSMTKLNSIDFEGLNQAIADLQTVVEPMANFFGKFSR